MGGEHGPVVVYGFRTDIIFQMILGLIFVFLMIQVVQFIYQK